MTKNLKVDYEREMEKINKELKELNVKHNERQKTLNDNKTMNPHFNGLRFDDIKSAFKIFKGDYHTNVTTWINHFDEQCETLQLTEMQKFIFAKRMLEGPAKLFLDYESKATTWTVLKEELQDEFGQLLNSAIVHQKLKERRKTAEETNLEYLYEMLSIAILGNIDIEATLSYTTDGLPGSIQSKHSLYEATTLKEFKRKLIIYESIQSKSKQKPENDEKNNTNCFNCGEKTHMSSKCPNKNKGPKCFKCNSFGHLSSSCSEPTKSMNIIRLTDNECHHLDSEDHSDSE